MEMAVKMMKRAARGAGRRRCWRRCGELLPCRRLHGGAPPLSPLPSWLLGSPPLWRWDPWGRQKCGFWRLQFVGGGVIGPLGFSRQREFIGGRAMSKGGPGAHNTWWRDQGMARATLWCGFLLAALRLSFGLRLRVR
jgi:hypothetical protein